MLLCSLPTNPLSPIVNLQILVTDFNTFSPSVGNFFPPYTNYSCLVISSLILMTCVLNIAEKKMLIAAASRVNAKGIILLHHMYLLLWYIRIKLCACLPLFCISLIAILE